MMKDYLNEINDSYPIRREEGEKEDFFKYVQSELGEDRVRRETLEKKHNNIIIDDISSAKVIFTAHYDTPAKSVIPNLMMPANKGLAVLYQLALPLLLAIAALVVSFSLQAWLQFDSSLAIVIYLILYYVLFFRLTRNGKNKHNKNDNTSGVATIMSIAYQIRDSKVAFVLFDNEEQGILGSKAFAKEHANKLEGKLIINFDCVGNGDQFVFVVKDGAEQSDMYHNFKSALNSNGDFGINYLPAKKTMSNSDHKRFDCSIGVMACNKGKRVRFITDRIHTDRDTLAEEKNIVYLTDRMIEFVSHL